MNKKKKLIFFLYFILVSHCSFDNKTGIWNGENETKKTSELKKNEDNNSSFVQIYSSEDPYYKEISLEKPISLSEPIKNLSWPMSNLNHQNFLGNIYLSGISNIF